MTDPMTPERLAEEALRVDGACFERLGHIRPYRVLDEPYAASAPWAAAEISTAGRGEPVGAGPAAGVPRQTSRRSRVSSDWAKLCEDCSSTLKAATFMGDLRGRRRHRR